MHFNARSLLPKLELLNIWLTDQPVDILTISETWFHPALDEMLTNLNGYTCYRHDRLSKARGGGLAIYIRDELQANYDCTKYENLNTSTADSELQVLSVKVRSMKKIMLVNCYRPPSGSVPRFFDEIRSVLDGIDKLGEHELYVMGDLNIPYNLPSPALAKVKSFENSYDLTQVIKSPTRSTASSSNILDLIFTNSPYVAYAGPIEASMSDHEPVLIIRKEQHSNEPKVSFKCRNFGNYVKEDFQSDVRDHDWATFFSPDIDANEKWSEMMKGIMSVADKHCPFKEHKRKKYVPPWLNQEILENLKSRDDLYKKAKKSKTELDWIAARKARNNCVKIVNAAKNNYILNLLQTEEKNSKKFWKVIQQVLPNSQSSNQQVHLIDQQSGLEVLSDQVPDYINNHFCQIGATLSNSFSSSPKFCASVSNFSTTFRLEYITLSETLDLIKGIDVCKSSAVDGLTSRVLKDAFEAIPHQLLHLFNCSIESGCFPQSWKLANVVTIHKGGSTADVCNYRPISLLPLPGKMLEKIIHRKLLYYLESNHLLTERQGGFRPAHSTTNTASSFVKDLMTALNKKLKVAALFIDFRKAFDVIDHEILLDKLHSVGVCPLSLNWFKSYLVGRKQRTFVNNTSSVFQSITYGVPQGSCLGPLFFLIYINDMVQSLESPLVHLYADDTVLYQYSTSLPDLENKLQAVAKRLEDWCKLNRLVINSGKSKVMSFQLGAGPRPDLCVTLEDEKIEQVCKYKYLGFVIDERLQFDHLFSDQFSKLNHLSYLLAKVRPYLTTKAAALVFKSKFLAYLDYVSLFSYSFSKKDQSRLQVIQNKCIRTIYQLPRRTNVDAHHVYMGILHVDNRRYLHLMKYCFYETLDIHNLQDHAAIMTRQTDKILLKVEHPYSEKFKRSFVYRGPVLWNSLTAEEQLVNDIDLFTRRQKRKLLEAEKALYSDPR